MSQTKLDRPAYAETFRCIGPVCEDTCCQGWNVPIDQAAHERYLGLPPSPLRTLIDASILVAPPGANPAAFAQIRMDGDNQCPLFAGDRLCRVHTELGESFLSQACATYPRLMHEAGGVRETALALSCPEAARLVLLTPGLLTGADSITGEGCAATGSNDAVPLLPWFWPIRRAVMALAGNRAYPLWQRLFLLGVFCRRLDSIAAGELSRTVPDFLHDFEVSVKTGALRPAMDTLPVDRAAQLDVVLRLAGMLLHRSNVRPRFVECVQAFTAGIGNGPGATLESLAANYTVAHDRHYAPFFDRHPYILENYLANTIVRCRFPFGREGMKPGGLVSMAREFALLTAQFALVKGLLIGVAGFHREGFSAAHVVHTVQAASKHFEHHPEFLDLAHALLVECRMDGARGLAILLRNAEPRAARPASARIQAPNPEAGTAASQGQD